MVHVSLNVTKGVLINTLVGGVEKFQFRYVKTFLTPSHNTWNFLTPLPTYPKLFWSPFQRTLNFFDPPGKTFRSDVCKKSKYQIIFVIP